MGLLAIIRRRLPPFGAGPIPTRVNQLLRRRSRINGCPKEITRTITEGNESKSLYRMYVVETQVNIRYAGMTGF